MKNLYLCKSFKLYDKSHDNSTFVIFEKGWYFGLRSMKDWWVWIRSFHSGLLIQSNLSAQDWAYNWSIVKLIEDNSRKLALCLGFSSLNKSRSDSLPVSNSNTIAWKSRHMLGSTVVCLKPWYIFIGNSIVASRLRKAIRMLDTVWEDERGQVNDLKDLNCVWCKSYNTVSCVGEKIDHLNVDLIRTFIHQSHDHFVRKIDPMYGIQQDSISIQFWYHQKDFGVDIWLRLRFQLQPQLQFQDQMRPNGQLCFLSYSRNKAKSCNVIISGMSDLSVGGPQAITETCLTFRDIPWWAVWPWIVAGAIIFLVWRSFQFEMSISSRLKTSSAGQPWTY
jgi:hypothetical protein